MPLPANRHAAAEHFTRLLQRFSTQLKKTLRAPAAEAIHDLRVAIRRFDQILITFKEWLDPRHAQAARRRLKTLFSNAGAVRDWDIGIELLGKSGADIATLADEMQLRRKRALRRLVASMRGMVRQSVSARWSSELLPAMQPPPEAEKLSWEDLARQELPDRALKFFRSGKRACKKTAPEDLHKFRIAAKKFRYTFELFQSAFGPTAETRLDNLRALQSVLGDINDIHIVRKLADELGGGKKLEAMLRKKQRKKTAEFHSLWEAQFPPSEIEDWMEFLRRPLRKPVGRAEHTALRAMAAR